jgi:hypothetical protein
MTNELRNGYLTIRFAGDNRVYFVDGVQAYRYASYEDNMKANRSQPYSLVVLPTIGAEVTINEVSSHEWKEGKAPNWSVIYFDECTDLQVARFENLEQCERYAKYCEFGVLAIVGVRYEHAVVQAWENDHPDAYED